MDLPTCPSCGQSVLDDDARMCPFCGAAMDGSSKGKKQPPKAPVKKASSAAKPAAESKPQKSADKDDPFEITSAVAGTKAINCAPKPLKGRTQRVVCPMCETQGFVPKSALGKQVKCSNAKCMVPLFTAQDPSSKREARVPTRVSDDATANEEKLAKSAGIRKPMVIYIIVGVVVLACGIGFVALLGPDNDESSFNKPLDIALVPVIDETENAQQTSTKKKKESASTDYAAEAERLTQLMIQASRANNRDKAYCRRLTADAMLRQGKADDAEDEFKQLRVVNASNVYYRIEPRLSRYWMAIAAGNDGEAKKQIDLVARDVRSIPTSGQTAIQTTIALAAVLAYQDKIELAGQHITRQQRDQTIVAQLDVIRKAAWFSTVELLRDSGQRVPSPLYVSAWNEPLKTSVAVHLCVRKQWNAAIKWAVAQTEPATVSDALAEIAIHLESTSASPADSQPLLNAAKQAGSAVLFRVESILGRSQDEAWARAKAAFDGTADLQLMDMPDLTGIVRGASPSTGDSELLAAAITDFAASAVRRGETDQATSAVSRIHTSLGKDVPATAATRKAVDALDSSENSLRQQLKERFGTRSDSALNARFREYRSKLDRLARAAENRRSVLIRNLQRIVESGGAAVVSTAIESNAALKQELLVDNLCQLLNCAAMLFGSEVPACSSPDASLAVALPGRTEPAPELILVPSFVKAMEAFRESDYSKAVANLANRPELSGLRSCWANVIMQKAAEATNSPGALITAISTEPETWREEQLGMVCRILTSRGTSGLDKVIQRQKFSALERTIAYHGIVVALVEAGAKPKDASN